MNLTKPECTILAELLFTEFGITLSTSGTSPALGLGPRVTDSEWLNSLSEEDSIRYQTVLNALPAAVATQREIEEATELATTVKATAESQALAAGIAVESIPYPFKAGVDDFPFYMGMLQLLTSELTDTEKYQVDTVTLKLRDGVVTLPRELAVTALTEYGQIARLQFGALLQYMGPVLPWPLISE